jgi:hypothetical protein
MSCLADHIPYEAILSGVPMWLQTQLPWVVGAGLVMQRTPVFDQGPSGSQSVRPASEYGLVGASEQRIQILPRPTHRLRPRSLVGRLSA